jgi:hypothetical protein
MGKAANLRPKSGEHSTSRGSRIGLRFRAALALRSSRRSLTPLAPIGEDLAGSKRRQD